MRARAGVLASPQLKVLVNVATACLALDPAARPTPNRLAQQLTLFVDGVQGSTPEIQL